MSINADLKNLSQSLGADYYGIADLAPARDYIQSFGGSRIAGYPLAISMGIALLDTLVDLLPEREDYAAAMLYRHNSYDVVNLALDRMALMVANRLQNEGFRALPVPASKRASDEKIAGVFSHKLAAHLAGLGWIGKSCLLVTPNHGPRVRWVTVLTDAPVGPAGTPMDPQCGSCTLCTDACPREAIKGQTFLPDESREVRLDAADCDRYFHELEKANGIAVCGMCLYICPYGRKGQNPVENGRV